MDSDNSSNHGKMFDLDQLSENSDNIEAIQYLRQVRQQANLPQNRMDSDEDEQLIIEVVQPHIPTQWQQECVKQFNSLKQNIIKLREWKQSITSAEFNAAFISLDLQYESELQSISNKKMRFLSAFENTMPTMYFIANKLDYAKAVQLLNWLCEQPSNTYSYCYWVYVILTQLEDPMECDTMANLNRILKEQQQQPEDGRHSTLIAILQIVFRQQ